jgi:hypothetical protein
MHNIPHLLGGNSYAEEMDEYGGERPRLPVLSPFLDRGHDTERIVVKWITRFAGDFEIHFCGYQVEDSDLCTITWHRIPKMRGSHLLNIL